MKKLDFNWFFALFLVFASGSAQSALISADLYTPNDGLLTLDTDTGLEWLDWSETEGLTVAQILGGEGGFLSQGFRYATRNELSNLLLGGAGFTVLDDFSEIHDAPAQAFNILFNTNGSACSIGTSCGIYLNDAGTGVDIVNVQSSLGGGVPTAMRWFDYGALDYSISGYGNVMVRSSVVPIPATVWLLFSGLLSFAAFCRTKKTGV